MDNTTSTPAIKALSLTKLLQQDTRHRWLIDGIMVADETMVIGGPMKTLKTSLMLDLAVSLASGTPFLGHFRTRKKCKVCLFTGESSIATLQESIERILKAKGVTPGECDLIVSSKLPALRKPDELEQLRQFLRKKGVEVVIIDPLYLYLYEVGTSARDASNLFAVGPVLQAITRACQCCGATVVFVHHTVKNSQTRATTQLSDLAFAGVGEFARQALLLNRTRDYEPGSPHYLSLVVGGSAGHASLWELTVDDRFVNDKMTRRKWSVTVTPGDYSLLQPAKTKHDNKRAGAGGYTK